LACSTKGRIYFLSNSYPGSVNDQAAYNQPENQLHLKIPSDEGILCDAGFVGASGYPNLIVTLKASVNDSLTDDQTKYNNNIKKLRIVVENVFSQLKRWAMCSEILRENIIDGSAEEMHHMVWTIASALHNMFGENFFH